MEMLGSKESSRSKSCSTSSHSYFSLRPCSDVRRDVTCSACLGQKFKYIVVEKTEPRGTARTLADCPPRPEGRLPSTAADCPPGGSVHGERANFTGLVLACIEADVFLFPSSFFFFYVIKSLFQLSLQQLFKQKLKIYHNCKR